MPFHGGIKKYVKKAVAKATGTKAATSKRRGGPGSARAKPPVPTAKPKRVPPLGHVVGRGKYKQGHPH
jgi:hypothetical protein